MSEYNPWKFVLSLPVLILLEGLHVVCECFRLIDDNLVCPVGENLEEWLSD